MRLEQRARAGFVVRAQVGQRGGGKICDGASASLTTDMRSYERIEDLHLILMHLVVCWFKENQDKLG